MSILRRRSPSRPPADIDLGPNAAHVTSHYGSPMGSMSPTLTQGQPQTPAAAARARVRFAAKPRSVKVRPVKPPRALCGAPMKSDAPCARKLGHADICRDTLTLATAAAARRTRATIVLAAEDANV